MLPLQWLHRKLLLLIIMVAVFMDYTVPQRYQHVWSMGTSYSLADDGTSSGTGGNLYGLAFTYNPNYAYSGSNAQARSGLNHQMLLMMNGTSYAAIGNGMWTTGTISSNAQGTLWGSSNDGAGSGLVADYWEGNYPPIILTTTIYQTNHLFLVV